MDPTSTSRDSILRLPQDTKRKVAKLSDSVKSLTKFLSDAVDKAKDIDFPEAIDRVVPWAEDAVEATTEALAEALPPVKFLVKLSEKLTEINDPEELGHLACTIAFERAMQRAIKIVGSPVEEKRAYKEAKEQMAALEPCEEVDLGALSYENAVEHEFFKRAELNMQTALLVVGYSGPQVDRVSHEVKDQFVIYLRKLLTDRKTAEKFGPFKEYIELGGSKERQSYKALAEHAQYQRWLFEDAPVLGKAPFSLQDIYVETDCGKLTWKEINPPEQRPGLRRTAESQSNEKRVDPFSEHDGGRQPLVETVMELIGNPQLREPIIIQGIAGAGKSSFTLRLCVELLRHQLRPIRVRFKDIRFDKHISDALPQAVELSGELRSPNGIPPTPEDIFRRGQIFREKGVGKYSDICRYVLILDGWDEISVANEGFKRRVEQMLEQVRREYIDNPTLPYPVRVILTGRPSADVNESGFLRDKTPILTIRPLTPTQLQVFIQGLSRAVDAHSISSPEEEAWPNFDPQKFEPVFKRYHTEFNRLLAKEQSQDPREEEVGSLGVLGLPLLTLLAARLISVWKEDPEQLVRNPTTLYRNLVNLTCEKSGKADLGPDDDDDEIRNQSRIVGYELRDLLWQTAAAMTIFGKDLIPYEELSKRLKLEGADLAEQVGKTTTKHSLSSLLISFYFKGGIRHLGCEFVHKSFREYLFAEAIVEILKKYGEFAPDYLSERDSEKYWRDFSETDDRYSFSRDLALLLSPQWISPEVKSHLDNLLAWEVGRSTATTQFYEAGTATPMINVQQWWRVRDGLADLWDWWAEGIHLRPQPHLGTRRQLTYEPPYVLELIEHSLPFDSASTVIQPPRTATMDAHLGDGIFTLCVMVHYYVGRINEPSVLGEQNYGKPTIEQMRKYQSQNNGQITFAPTRPDPVYFKNYVNRINSAGWRPYYQFPANADLRGVDLSNADLSHISFIFANLDGAKLEGASLIQVDLTGASLREAVLKDAFLSFVDLSETFLAYADLTSARLQHSYLNSAVLDGATLASAHFIQVDFEDAYLVRANLSAADLEMANLRDVDLTEADLTDANLERVELRGAVLSRTNLSGANLRGARGLSPIQLMDVIIDEETTLTTIQLSLFDFSTKSGRFVSGGMPQ